jgi:hypothetical protein
LGDWAATSDGAMGVLAGDDAGGAAGAVTGAATGAIGAALICEAAGAAASCTLLTIARLATDVRSGTGVRSTSDKTTPAPAVAPIAVATSTIRAVRAKLGAEAR